MDSNNVPYTHQATLPRGEPVRDVRVAHFFNIIDERTGHGERKKTGCSLYSEETAAREQLMVKRDKPPPSCFSREPELTIKDTYQMILRRLLNTVSLVHELVHRLLLWLLWFWSRLDAPGCEQVPGSTEIGSLYLFERLITDSIIILAHAAPFLEKWAKRSEHTHPILDICLPFGDSRLILQGIGSCLYLLVAILA